jgi:hypothetical protein
MILVRLSNLRLARGVQTGFRACLIAVAIGLFLMGSSAAFAQSIFATMSGTVTDSTGALVIGAKVQVQNADTKLVRAFVTDKSGYFSATDLPIGTYNVTVVAKGFEQWVGSGIVLHGMEDRNLTVPLKIGAASEIVEVSASSGQIDITDSGAKAETLTSDDLEKEPLIGRNATEILRIIPGAAQITLGGTNRPAADGSVIGVNGFVANGSNAGGMAAVSINGQSGQGISINEDGQNAEDPGAPGAATPVNPNPDMIAEVSILTSNYGADNAKGPVVINALSKSGGSAIHGDAHFYARNSSLNAEDAFSKAEEVTNGQPKGYLVVPNHFYYPGADIGGPVYIPHTRFNSTAKTKLFFHESFEAYLQLIDGGINTAFVPTANMISTGDFSQLASWDPSGGTQGGFWGIGDIPQLSATPTTQAAQLLTERPGCSITNGTMTQGCIDPNSQLWLKASLPTPTLSAPNAHGDNYVSPVQEPQNDYHNMAKIDIEFSDNTKAYISWSHQQEVATMPLGLWQGSGNGIIPAPSSTIANNASDLYTFNFMHIFSPSLTVEARIGYTHEYMPGQPGDPAKVLRSQMGFPLTGVFGNPNAPVATSWSGSIPGIGDVGHDYHPTFYAEKGIPSTGADLTKVIRTHTLKAGYLWENLYNAQDAWGQYQGVFGYGYWNTNFTGNNYADILMGANQGYFEQDLPPTMKMGQVSTSFYATDHWKFNRHVTIDYGMRLEHFGAPTASDPWGLAAFDPSQYAPQSTAGTQNPGLSWYSLNPNTPPSGNTESFLVLTPRFGAAIDVFGNGKTVVRGGWGEYRYAVNMQTYQGAANTAAGSFGWSSPGSAASWEDIDKFKNNGGGTSTSCTADANGGIDVTSGTPGAHCAPTISLGTPTNFANGSITAADVRNHDQPYTITYSLNIDQQLPSRFMAEISYVGNHSNLTQNGVNMNPVPVGAMSSTAVGANSICVGQGATYTAQATSGYCQQQFRPYPYYQTLTAIESSSISQYDSFQAQLTRSVGWSTLNFNYAFSKNMGDSNQAGAFKDWGEKEYWTPSNQDRAHVFNASYIFSTPKMSLANHFVNGLANGWQLSGVTQIQSGAMLTAVTGSQFDIANASNGVLLVGSPDVTVAPILTCNPKSGLHKGQYANPSCFTLPLNAGQGIGNTRFPYLAGPKYWNSDLALQKSINVKEQQHLDLRFSAFNFMNHALPSFQGGDSNLKLNFTSAGVLSNATDSVNACPGPNCAAFGYDDYHYGQRRLEVSAKYSF